MMRPLAVIGLWLAFASSAYPQTPALPRTPDGHPDFQGVWLSVFTTPFERLPGQTSLVVSEAEARKLGQEVAQRLYDRGAGHDPDATAAGANVLMKVNGEYRTSLIVEPVDGKLPVTPKGRAIIASARAKTPALPDDPEFRSEIERCITGTGRAPMALTPAQNPRQIVQTPGYFMIYSEDGPDLRAIPIAGQHRPTAMLMWGGDSTASWEGDELVVETVNARGQVRTGPNYAFVQRPESRALERFRLLSRDEILYSYTIIDPEMYSQPWRVEYVLSRTAEPSYEYSCHEGNYALVNMLSAARAHERRLAKQAGPVAKKPAKPKAGKPKPKP